MTIQNPSAAPTGGKRRPLRLIVPIPPRASPRACLEAQVEFLLDMLDRISGDPDLEETGDLEPSLAGHYFGSSADLELDDSDKEPSLGSFDRMLDQSRWCGEGFVNGVDLELDRADYEPSLGSPYAGIGDQRRWCDGGRHDREVEHEDWQEDDDYSGGGISAGEDDAIFPKVRENRP